MKTAAMLPQLHTSLLTSHSLLFRSLSDIDKAAFLGSVLGGVGIASGAGLLTYLAPYLTLSQLVDGAADRVTDIASTIIIKLLTGPGSQKL